jgi:hypothetical protein
MLLLGVGGRRDGVMEEKWLAASGVLQCFLFEEKIGRASPISEGERSMQGSSWFPCGGVTGGCSGAVAHGSRSRAACGLTLGGRQVVGPKGCLGRIPLWRSNMLSKWNGLGKRDSWAERKL